jgi:hypothetical protein
MKRHKSGRKVKGGNDPRQPNAPHRATRKPKARR